MKPLIILLILFGTSCKYFTEKDADIILKEYSKQNQSVYDKVSIIDTTFYEFKGGEYKVITDKYSNGILFRVRGFFLNNPDPYGTYFRFLSNGKLDKHFFLCSDGKSNTYQLDFSMETDTYHEQGNAFVDSYIPQSIKDTGNSFTLIFSTFPRSEIEASYSVDKVNFNKLDIHPNGLDPFTCSAELILSKQQAASGILLKIKSKNLWFPIEGLQDVKETYDTLYLYNEFSN